MSSPVSAALESSVEPAEVVVVPVVPARSYLLRFLDLIGQNF